MKKIIYALGIMVAGAFTSCDLDTPLESTADEELVFSDPGLTLGAVNGIKIPFGETNAYRGRFIPWYGMNTDVEWHNNSHNWQSGDQYDLVNYDPKPGNSQMNTENNAWAMMYSSIERANIVIQGIRANGNPEPGTDMGHLLGEALTLRALVYADLTKAWGDVPYRFEPINSETLYIAKSSRDEIYKQLLDDLEEAAELTPWPNETAWTISVERVNKAFVKGLRARIALVAGGYAQYPDGIRLSNDPDLSRAAMYQIALKECEDIINSGTARLENTFEGLWRKFNREEIAAGGESLWELPFAAGRGRVNFTFGVRHRTSNQHTAQARGGTCGPLPNLFYDYDVKDQRRGVTCVPYEWGDANDQGWAQQQLASIDRWMFGKYRYEWMERRVTSSNDDGLNWMYMRYAEVLLMAAEAANELQGPGAAAPYLRAVRSRAFAPDDHAEKVDQYIAGLGSQQAMFRAIVDEHKFEFTGEMLRKQALIRWNLLGEKLNETEMQLGHLANRTGNYANVPETLYWKIDEEDNESLIIYGLNPGETDPPEEEGYSEQDWTNFNENKINSVFKPGVNPDERQFWPIWQVFIDGSNGLLVNDYGY